MIRALSALLLLAALTVQPGPAGDAWSRIAALYHQRLAQFMETTTEAEASTKK